MKMLSRVLLMVLVLGLGAYSCDKGNDSGDDGPTNPSGLNPGPGQGTLKVKLTDKPSVDFQKIFVTIELVRIHQSSGAADGTAGWVDMPVTLAMPVDLLTLQNGVVKDLTGTVLTAGSYQQIRLQLTPNSGSAAPYANSVVLADGTEYPLEVPGGSIKIVHGVTVVEGQTEEVVIDFDAKLSVKQRGNGTYYMQPVIKASTK
jgi:hypothetical protein